MGLFDGTPLERPVLCEGCGRPVAECVCPPAAEDPPGPPPPEQSPRVRRERRRGKWSAVVTGLEHDAAGLKALAKQLKNKLSVGGGVNDGQIILQGDCADRVVEELRGLGYRAKRAGG